VNFVCVFFAGLVPAVKKKPAQNIVQLLGNTKSLTFHEFSSFIDT